MVKRLLLVAGILLLLWLVAGCGVAQEQYDAVVADLNQAQAELQSVRGELDAAQANVSVLTSTLEESQNELEVVKDELAEIKKVYPPQDFPSKQELMDWLLANDVSDRPAATNAEALYAKALEIQHDALEDGYIVSAWIDYFFDEELFYINCTAVAGGVVWMWHPETDELTNFSDLTGLLKLS